MSGAALLQAALAERLRAAPALADVTVFDAPPARAAMPHAIVEEPMTADWGAKGLEGRRARVAIILHDAGERPVRLRALAAAAEAAVAGTDGAIGDGWRIVTTALQRTRLARRGAGAWIATIEFEVRMARTG